MLICSAIDIIVEHDRPLAQIRKTQTDISLGSINLHRGFGKPGNELRSVGSGGENPTPPTISAEYYGGGVQYEERNTTIKLSEMTLN